jgi:hypothetical protein
MPCEFCNVPGPAACDVCGRETGFWYNVGVVLLLLIAAGACVTMSKLGDLKSLYTR